jgi:hypothetical protein
MFSPEEYTHATPGKAVFQIGLFVAAVFTLCGAVYLTYPDKPSAPKEYEGGLERELGGPKAVRVSDIRLSLLREICADIKNRLEPLGMSIEEILLDL